MTTQDKIDLFKQHKDEYRATARPRIVTVGRARYLAIDGKGTPASAAFQRAIGALYGMAYTIKMTRKFSGRQDYVVGKLEAVYRAKSKAFTPGQPLPKDLAWTLMIRTPDLVERGELSEAVAALESKGKGEGAGEVRLETLDEGQCVQVLHVGPYEDEAPSVAAMLAHAEAEGLRVVGPHHEIYLSDPRRTAPEKLKTILRAPVSR